MKLINSSSITLGRHFSRYALIVVSVLISVTIAAQDDTGIDTNTNETTSTIKLESTFVGDKEQPSVSYFIPWKGTDSPDELQWKIERKNDDTLSIVDREILLRSMTIYDQMKFEP